MSSAGASAEPTGVGESSWDCRNGPTNMDWHQGQSGEIVAASEFDWALTELGRKC